MDYSGEGAGVYAEAKGEYTRQLCQFLTPALHKYFLDLLDLAKEREQDPKKHLVAFQNLLEAISEWNIDKVQRETQSVSILTQCDYLEELLTAVFIAHTKVLSAIRLTNRHKKLQITIPKLEHFLHRTMTECARILWTNTFLFSTSGTPLERQKNMRQVESLITDGVLQGVRSMLPVKSILREYLGADESGGETDQEEDEAEEAEEAEEMPMAAEELPVAAEEPPVAAEKPPMTTQEPPVAAEECLVGPTGTAEIPTIQLTDIPAEIEQTTAPLFKEALENSDPPARSTTPPPRAPTPVANVIKEPASAGASAADTLDELEEVADLPIFEEDKPEETAKVPEPDSDNEFEFEELS